MLMLKNALLFGLMKKFPVKRTRKGSTKHKSASFKYIITHGGKDTFVCKTAFGKLLCIGKKKIDLVQMTIKKGVSAPYLIKEVGTKLDRISLKMKSKNTSNSIFYSFLQKNRTIQELQTSTRSTLVHC